MPIGRNTPAPAIPEAVTLQWANGKSMARPVENDAGVGRFAGFVGFHIEVGKDAELDALLTAAKHAQVEIRHPRQGAAPDIVRHWALGETIFFLPITAGPPAPTIGGCLSNGFAKKTADAGVGLRWGANERSKLAVRGFVLSLWTAGYKRPVQLAVRSRMTDRLLAALLDHVRVAIAADNLVDRAKHPAVVSPAELWLPLGAGEEAEFGKGDTATVTPLVSLHEAEITSEYLRSRWRTNEQYDATEAAWRGVQQWAADYAVGAGEELEAHTPAPAEPEPPTPDEEPGLFDEVAPASPTGDRVAYETGGATRGRRRR